MKLQLYLQVESRWQQLRGTWVMELVKDRPDRSCLQKEKGRISLSFC